MAGKHAATLVLSVTGAVLMLIGVLILAFSSHYLPLLPVLYLATPVLSAIILVGALLTGSENGKRAVAGSAIVLALSTVVFCFSLLPVFLTYAGRLMPYILALRNLGTSGLIDFLGGFVPSTIGIVGVMLCVAGGVLGLRGRTLLPSFSSSRMQLGEIEESTVCPECGAVNSASYKFCFKCGARLKPLEKKTGEDLTAEPTVCPVCGKTSTEDSKFCSQCGAPLSGGEQLPPPPPDIESRLEKLEERVARLEKTLGEAGQPEGGEEGEAGESIFGDYAPD